MSNAIVTTRDTQLEKQRISKNQISLTEFDTTNEPAIAAGSVVEIGGSLFVVTVDEAITGWAGIANDTDAYIKLVPDVADFAAEFTTDAPTWSASKQGWYDGIDRYIGGLHRGAGAADYEDKWIYQQSQDNNDTHKITGDGDLSVDGDLSAGGDIKVTGDVDITGSIIMNSVGLKHKVLEIGNWDMAATVTVNIAHGLTLADIRSWSVTIIPDDSSNKVNFEADITLRGVSDGRIIVDAANVALTRDAAGHFDSVDYNDGTDFNRGWITLWYAP